MAGCGSALGATLHVRYTSRRIVPPALFLWDIDGTLLRGATAIHRDAFAHAYQAVYGLPLNLDGVAAGGRTDTWLLAEPLRRIGLSDAEIWTRMPNAFREMQAYVEQHLGDLSHCVLPGAREVLAELHARGYVQALVTGNLSRIAMAKLRNAGLARYFDVGGFGEESEVRERLVSVALRHAAGAVGTHIELRRSVVVGDTPFDLGAGQLNGTRTCGVATGTCSLEELEAAGADLLLPSLADAETAIDALVGLIEDGLE